MTGRLLVTFCLFGLALSGQQPECAAVTGDQIESRDLARLLPAFVGIPSDIPLAPTPAMGGSRVFSTSEIASIEKRFAIAPDGGTAAVTEPGKRALVLYRF